MQPSFVSILSQLTPKFRIIIEQCYYYSLELTASLGFQYLDMDIDHPYLDVFRTFGFGKHGHCRAGSPRFGENGSIIYED